MTAIKIVTASWLGLGEGRFLKDGAVTVAQNCVAAVGHRRALIREFPKAQEISFPDAIILPGFVDCHAHLELTYLLQQATAKNLFELMRFLGDGRGGLTEGTLQASRHAGATNSVRHGITCVVDWMTLRARPTYGVPRPRIMRALEIISATAPGPHPALERAVESHRSSMRPNWDKLAFAPHSLYMTAAPVWTQAAYYADSLGTVLTTHLAETKYEREWIVTSGGALVEHCLQRSGVASIPQGLSGPVAILQERKHLGPQCLLVHCVDVSEDELSILHTAGATVCLCPRSNQHLSGEMPRLTRIIEAGVRFCLGTDSFRGEQDLIAEACTLLRQVQQQGSRQQARVYAQKLVDAMTVKAGEAIGWPEAGRIYPGGSADFSVIHIGTVPEEMLMTALLEEGIPLMTMIDGEIFDARNPIASVANFSNLQM